MRYFLFAIVLLVAPQIVTPQSLCSQSQTSKLQNDKIYNLDFESIDTNPKSSANWQTGTTKSGYRVGIDSNQKRSGKYSLLIESIDKDVASKSGMSNIIIPAKFEGKEVEIRFYLKLEKVTGHADFPFRIDDEDNDKIQFTNLLAKRIYGTQDWKQYSLKLPLGKAASTINLFPLLFGPGKMWIDDVQILFDGVDIAEAKIRTDYSTVPYQSIDYGNNKGASGQVRVRDAELYYEIYGTGEPLLLLHGNSQSIRVFKKQIKEFSKTYQVIAVDTRGQGKSTDHISEPLSYNLFAEDMKTLLDTLHLKKANVVGWSDGGNTGIIMAIKFPEYVNKLAVTGACTDPNKAVSAGTLKEVAKAIKNLKTKTDEKSAYQIKLFTMLLTEPHITATDLNQIQIPVLIMAGETDMILEDHTKYISSNIKDSELFIFKGASHDVPVEKQEEFNNKVLVFLNK